VIGAGAMGSLFNADVMEIKVGDKVSARVTKNGYFNNPHVGIKYYPSNSTTL
jgi:hypothetical protein